jgi:hypothetical protein
MPSGLIFYVRNERPKRLWLRPPVPNALQQLRPSKCLKSGAVA